jgi:hypothetical protein
MLARSSGDVVIWKTLSSGRRQCGGQPASSQPCSSVSPRRRWPTRSPTFYSGKQIKFVIRAGVGGSYDSYSRLLGRHIGKHIPGNPSVVPLNMPGGNE